ncbi:MAG TPA: VOC family protein [Candidatus Dormibacteraeota bacterium]|jgi:uncharacterized glyoxalase superfamily protein PhnB|nr:VOC family protein [Candidatus Dormibacteraeota bacterium]
MLANRSIPRCTVIPELVYPDVEKAVKWLCDTFGFTLRIGMGSHRAQLNVGDGAVVLMEPRDESESRGNVMVRVEDVHRHCEHARQRGARIVREPGDYPYGERQYNVEDLAGHVWTFSQSIADVHPHEWGGTPGQL